MKSVLTLAVLALVTSSPSFAQYRYVAPDGTVSYSDTPPAGPASHVTVTNLPDTPLVAANPQLPYALSQAASHFPVTLYTMANCASCDGARAYLKQRGIPFTEKTVGSDADIAVVKQISGRTSLPVMTIGSHKILGYSQTDYASMLDDAGFPATSVLPRDYTYPAPVAASGAKPTPAPAAETAAEPSPAPASIQMAEPPPAQNAPPGFKF